MRTGDCSLFRCSEPLCKSHLIPAFFYKTMREAFGNERQTLVSGKRASLIFEQLRTPLLCRSCEGLFQQAEDRVAPSLLQADLSFPLRDLAVRCRSPPKESEVATLSCLELGHSALTHFAASILWRAGATVWGSYTIHLGP